MSSSSRITVLDSKKRRENGVVYTPASLASYVAEKVVRLAVEDLLAGGLGAHEILSRLRNFKIIDPACGEGDLLMPTWQALVSDLRARGMHDALTELDASRSLCGVDIDELSVLKTGTHIGSLSVHSTDARNVLVTNALLPESRELSISGWGSVKELFDARHGFDVLIANPPWGANTASYEKKLEEVGMFKLNKGQYDSSDLFVELAISLVKDGGYFAFILPDSLFGFERKGLRKLLIENTEIKFIGRLGEKIFEGVNRACVVLICKKAQPTVNSKTTCMRLTPAARKKILEKGISYSNAENQLAHVIKQTRFAESEDLLFDIDTKEEELDLLRKITAAGNTIGEYVTSGRGVELSKTGKVYQCNHCGFWSPLPTSDRPKCSHCDAVLHMRDIEVKTIISKKKFKGSKPILVGESVRRYSISSRWWIAVDSKGINYKSLSLYYEPKILVRKTGVGITATIDYSHAFTNQVVYIFKSRQDIQTQMPIEFILAVMNSRAVYYYLLKRYGEAEWRSHPYLTQSQVLGLPMPDLGTKAAGKARAQIVEILKPYLEKHIPLPKEVDAKVESLVATLFSLSKKDYELIYKTLNSTQGLIPVLELSAVGVEDIFK